MGIQKRPTATNTVAAGGSRTHSSASQDKLSAGSDSRVRCTRALTPESANVCDKVEHVNRVVIRKLRQGERADSEGKLQVAKRGVPVTT